MKICDILNGPSLIYMYYNVDECWLAYSNL